jgi:hypothetical protein
VVRGDPTWRPVSEPTWLVLAWAEYAVVLGALAYFLLWRRR